MQWSVSPLRAFLTLAIATAAFQVQRPEYRTTLVVKTIDVEVLSAGREPVRGLQPTDFTILVDGREVRVAAVTEVESPATTASPPGGTDVVINQRQAGRLVVLVLDDGTMPFDPYALRTAKDIGHQIVDGLASVDGCAVVFTRDNRRPQEFTTDHRMCSSAIDRTSYGNRGELAYIASLETLWEVVQSVRDLADQRRVVVLIGGGVPVAAAQTAPVLGGTTAARELASRLTNRLASIITEARLGNVSIYAFDVCGLRPMGAATACAAGAPDLNVEFLQTVAEGSGGRAFINSNDSRPHVALLFSELRSHYLVGLELDVPEKGGIQKLDVRVNRPGVRVQARTSALLAQSKGPLDGMRAAQVALAGVVPKTDLPLGLQLVPLWAGSSKASRVAVVLDIKSDSQTGVLQNFLTAIRAFGVRGQPRASRDLELRRTTYEEGDGIVTLIDLPPGSYHVRVGVNDRLGGRLGSVYSDVEVPDCQKQPVALSGAIVGTEKANASQDNEVLIPLRPSLKREFASTDRLDAFVQVCVSRRVQAPISVELTVSDRSDRALLRAAELLQAAQFTAKSVVNFQAHLPMTSMPPGEYRLDIEAVLGTSRAKRQLRFTVR